MKTEQEFWDDAILAAVSNMAGRRDYGVADFPNAMINDAERIADVLTERRSERLAASKKSLYDYYGDEHKERFYYDDQHEERFGDEGI